jgi:hypothetical protein
LLRSIKPILGRGFSGCSRGFDFVRRPESGAIRQAVPSDVPTGFGRNMLAAWKRMLFFAVVIRAPATLTRRHVSGSIGPVEELKWYSTPRPEVLADRQLRTIRSKNVPLGTRAGVL